MLKRKGFSASHSGSNAQVWDKSGMNQQASVSSPVTRWYSSDPAGVFSIFGHVREGPAARHFLCPSGCGSCSSSSTFWNSAVCQRAPAVSGGAGAGIRVRWLPAHSPLGGALCESHPERVDLGPTSCDSVTVSPGVVGLPSGN